MTVKSFFKSTAFKCVITLLCVLLVSGIFLTIAYGFLEVTDEDRENRSIAKIYGGNATIKQTLDTASYPVGDSKVEKGYVMSDGNYLIKTTGYGGYNGGSVTCWVVVKVAGTGVSGVGKVVIDGQTGQTLMSQYNDSTLDVFAANYKSGQDFDRSVITGATAKMTNGAITNAVNGSITYVTTALGGSTAEKTPFDDFKYTDCINTKDTKVDFVEGKLTYTIKTKGYGGVADPFTIEIVVNSEKKIESYTIKVNGSTDGYENNMPKVETILVGKDLSYFTGLYGEDMTYKAIASHDDNSVTTGASTDSIASNSTYLCMYAGAFATANYDNALKLGLQYTKNVNMDNTAWTVGEDGKVTYTIKTKGYGGVADPFTIEIVVNGEKKIESYTIKVNGSTDGYENNMPDVEKILKGKDLSYFTGLYGEDMAYKAIASHDDNSVTTGASTDSVASNSTYLCMYAGAFATANYDLALSIGGNANE